MAWAGTLIHVATSFNKEKALLPEKFFACVESVLVLVCGRHQNCLRREGASWVSSSESADRFILL